MSSIEEQIKELNDILDEAFVEIDKLSQEIKKLKGKSQELEQKEQELKDSKTKLITCQVERDNIRKQFGVKIEELNVSNLSKEERSGKISELMTGEYQKLRASCQRITQMWKNWGTAKDNLFELKKKLANSRLEAIKSLEKTKHRQWIIIWVLLVVVILLSLSLSLVIYQQISAKKKKKNR